MTQKKDEERTGLLVYIIERPTSPGQFIARIKYSDQSSEDQEISEDEVPPFVERWRALGVHVRVEWLHRRGKGKLQ